MDEVGLACAWGLAVVFAWAGVAKLSDRSATAVGFAALGLPAPRPAAVAVPVLETVLAVGLVLAPAPAALGALVLLVVFSAVLARAILSGVEVGCRCFGAASGRDRVSAADLVRNGGLAAGAVLATGATGPAVPSLAAVVLVGTLAAAGSVVVALVDLATRTGGLLRLPSPQGEAVPAGLPDPGRRERDRAGRPDGRGGRG